MPSPVIDAATPRVSVFSGGEGTVSITVETDGECFEFTVPTEPLVPLRP